MIELDQLTKRYGGTTAVDHLSFTVRPGIVTGFLGPNGAGKSTTMRLLLGLEQPTSGTATVNGRNYRDHATPIHEIGVLLEAKATHPGRTARDHLLAMAYTHRLSARRVDEVLELVGLSEVASHRAGTFSLGMSQRLGIATALLGNPRTVVLDEPVNGLDPEGIRWIRDLLKRLAAEGRTVFLSSHLMSEMALTADHLIVVGRGRLIADVSVAELTNSAVSRVRVVSPQAAQLPPLLLGEGVEVTTSPDGSIAVTGLPAAEIGRRAAAAGLVLHELTPTPPSLEEAFMHLTADSVDYHGSRTETGTPGSDAETTFPTTTLLPRKAA